MFSIIKISLTKHKAFFFSSLTLTENFGTFQSLSQLEEKSLPDLRYPTSLSTADTEEMCAHNQHSTALESPGPATKDEIDPCYENQHRPHELCYTAELMKH